MQNAECRMQNEESPPARPWHLPCFFARMSDADVIVVGAGAAGLAAARDLSAAGLDVLLIEARGRHGGRAYTRHEAGLAMPVELGAEFVHGEAEEVFRLIGGTRVLVDRLPDVHWWSERGKFRERPDFWERVRAILARAAKTRADLPVADFLRRTHIAPADRKLVEGFVQGYHAADLGRVSSHSLASNDSEEQDDHNPQFRVITGYDSLLDVIHAGFVNEHVEVRSSTVVTRIRWRRGSVDVDAIGPSGQEQQHRARAVVVTVPVGVLRSDAISWEPRPPGLPAALAKLEMGNVCKIVFEFRERFWAEKDFLRSRAGRGTTALELNFVHAAGDFPTWWSHSPATVPLLTAWSGGPPAARLLDAPEPQRIDRALGALARIFAMPRPRIDDLVARWWTHDWSSDPFSRGAYSYELVGASGARKKLARPVEQTLFFAGEAVEPEQSGTVVGAIASGRAAAAKVTAAFR